MIKKGLPGQKYKNPGGIYMITCTATNDTYIGKTRNLNNRYSQHSYDLRNHRHNNPALQALYDTYGPKCLVMTLVERIPDEEIEGIEAREVYWTEFYKPTLNVVHTKLSKQDASYIIENVDVIGKEAICTKYNITNKYLNEILRGDKWDGVIDT